METQRKLRNQNAVVNTLLVSSFFTLVACSPPQDRNTLQAEPETVDDSASPDQPDDSASPAQSDVSARYPNELPGYRFHTEARWKTLSPLRSTLGDIRRVLGDPDEAHDIANYSEPYPGDAAAVQPVLTYNLTEDWQLLIYMVKSDLSQNERYPAACQDKLLSLDLLSHEPIGFADVPLPSSFAKNFVIAADASWNEYRDSSGLSYDVYAHRNDAGEDVLGNLNRISYGPSDADIADAETVCSGSPGD